MEYFALKMLDSAPRDAGIYQLLVTLAQRCRELSRMRIGGQRVNLIEEAFREEIMGRGHVVAQDAPELPAGEPTPL